MVGKLSTIEIFWENQETAGCEYLKQKNNEEKIYVESTTIYFDNQFNKPAKIDYQIIMNDSWEIICVNIQNEDLKELKLTSNGKGKWFDHTGHELPELSGAIDIDISSTPFSNSLPINRYIWKINQKRDFQMVLVSTPSLEIQKVPQTYTYVSERNGIRVFKYESNHYATFISVDKAGYVLDYPNVFIRR